MNIDNKIERIKLFNPNYNLESLHKLFTERKIIAQAFEYANEDGNEIAKKEALQYIEIIEKKIKEELAL